MGGILYERGEAGNVQCARKYESGNDFTHHNLWLECNFECRFWLTSVRKASPSTNLVYLIIGRC